MNDGRTMDAAASLNPRWKARRRWWWWCRDKEHFGGTEWRKNECDYIVEYEHVHGLLILIGRLLWMTHIFRRAKFVIPKDWRLRINTALCTNQNTIWLIPLQIEQRQSILTMFGHHVMTSIDANQSISFSPPPHDITRDWRRPRFVHRRVRVQTLQAMFSLSFFLSFTISHRQTISANLIKKKNFIYAVGVLIYGT